MAKTEPPGRHRSSTGSPYERPRKLLSQDLCLRRFYRIAPGPFQTRSGESSGADAVETP